MPLGGYGVTPNIPISQRLKKLEAQAEEIEALLEIFKTEKGQLKITKLSVIKKDIGNKLKVKYETKEVK